MAIRQAKSGAGPVPDALYRQLAEAAPAERSLLVLQLISEHPQHQLCLPARGRQPAILNEIDLSPTALEQLYRAADSPPAWWRAPDKGINLRNADLRGAQLRKADLQGADLTGANLQDAMLGGAHLQSALLEGANLRGADLAGATLQNAVLAGANLEGAMLEDASLTAATLRYARLKGAVLEGADLQKADLWGTDLDSANLEEANLQRAVLREASLRRADLSGANLSYTVMRSANLQEAVLVGADLQGALLGDTNFADAVLRYAKLQDLDLSTCNMTHVQLSGARMDETQLYVQQLGGVVGEELARDYRRAAQAYLVLERNFRDLGDRDAASWAYRRRRRMQKREVLRQARQARQSGRWRLALFSYAQYASDRFVEWLCDYGESVPRVLRAMLTVYLVFALLYLTTGSVARMVQLPGGTQQMVPTRDLRDIATFALVSMTQPEGPTVGLMQRETFVHVLTALQTLLSIALTGLLGFVIGNRIRR